VLSAAIASRIFSRLRIEILQTRFELLALGGQRRQQILQLGDDRRQRI
jgi:hypothetical protein